MKTAINIVKTLVIGFIVWLVSMPIIYYVGTFFKWISKVLITEYWQNIIQGIAMVTVFGCFIWLIGYVFLHLFEWIKWEIQLNKRDKQNIVK